MGTNQNHDNIAILHWNDAAEGILDRLLWNKIYELLCAQRWVVLDLSGLEYIDSRALYTLLLSHIWAVTQGRKLKLCGASSSLLRAIEDENCGNVLHIYRSSDEAVAAFETEAERDGLHASSETERTSDQVPLEGFAGLTGDRPPPICPQPPLIRNCNS